ncbi:MAG: hypothetical protein WAZ18_02800 [Alphaproteobacteria bacterium]
MEPSISPILFLSGYQGAGKDTLANMLVERYGFQSVHSIWWIKQQAATALAMHVPLDKVEGYLSTDHVLKELPLPFEPFNGLSSRAWQKKEGKRYGYAEKVEKLLQEKLLPRTTPLVVTGMRVDKRHEMMRQAVKKHGLPALFVWVKKDVVTPLAESEKAPDLYPPEPWFDICVTNVMGQPKAMWEQLGEQYPTLKGLEKAGTTPDSMYR